jgi:hypothetical protein
LASDQPSPVELTELHELLRPGLRSPRRKRRPQNNVQSASNDVLNELLASYREHLYFEDAVDADSQARVRRALLLAIAISLGLWLAIGIAVFELLASLS